MKDGIFRDVMSAAVPHSARGAAATIQQASYGGQRIPIHGRRVRRVEQLHPPAVGTARGRTFVIQKLD